MGKKLLKLLLVIGVLIVILIIVGVWMVWKRPLEVDARFSRLALGKQGFEQRRVATPAGRMTVWEGGSGPCMVLLHGAGDQAGAWARVAGTLVESYHVVIPDLPGHWKSDPRKGPIRFEQLLAGAEAAVDAGCGQEPAIVVGNSLGAWLAMLMADRHPERIDRVVAINGGAIRENDPQVNLFPTNREEAAETMKGLMGPATPPLPGFVLDDVVRWSRVGPAARFAAGLTEAGSDVSSYLLDGRLDEVTVPVELVWGDADALFTLDYARRLRDGLPRARLHVVENCGHVPHRECPDLTADAILSALSLPPPEAAMKGNAESGDDTDSEAAP